MNQFLIKKQDVIQKQKLSKFGQNYLIPRWIMNYDKTDSESIMKKNHLTKKINLEKKNLIQLYSM